MESPVLSQTPFGCAAFLPVLWDGAAFFLFTFWWCFLLPPFVLRGGAVPPFI